MMCAAGKYREITHISVISGYHGNQYGTKSALNQLYQIKHSNPFDLTP